MQQKNNFATNEFKLPVKKLFYFSSCDIIFFVVCLQHLQTVRLVCDSRNVRMPAQIHTLIHNEIFQPDFSSECVADQFPLVGFQVQLKRLPT